MSDAPPPTPSVEAETLRHVWRMCRRLSSGSLSVEVPSSWPALRSQLARGAPELLGSDSHTETARSIEEALLETVSDMGRTESQAQYEELHRELEATVTALDHRLTKTRYLNGSQEQDFGYADLLLFAFLVRLEPIYFDLFKCTFGPVEEFRALYAYGCDLFERSELFQETDLRELTRTAFLDEKLLNRRGVVPLGGKVNWHRPHARHLIVRRNAEEVRSRGTQDAGATTEGEWVRGESRLRHWIRSKPDAEFAAEPGRYHLFAPYNCPWSHRALLGRSIKGLDRIVGASILYFRRHPEHGWQFNAHIPGCTRDQVAGQRFLAHYYESVGSSERSAPVLWDTKSARIVNNESADILRMFNRAFDAFLPRDTIDLVPPELERDIDQLNELIYQRINNGAYKAGFTQDQQAYERAYHRYFAALEYLEELLGKRAYLLTEERPTEADLRLFPTLFRHDAVYYARFKLNQRRLADFPRLSAWLDRMLALEPIAAASNLDHARNGYFGRTGTGVVPLGPTPLGLSRSNFSDEVWLGEAD